MPSSGLQLLGFALSLVGLAATIAATCMAEWKRYSFEGNNAMRQNYEGLWMRCRSHSSSVTCEFYESLMKVAEEIQATRAVMLVSIFLSSVAVLVSTVGMKCTRFLEGSNQTKSMVALVGGLMFMISGVLTLAITSWYVRQIVQFEESHPLNRREFEFGSAVFVSWGGAILTLAGGAFLSCRRCSGSGASKTPLKFRPSSTPGTDYV